MGFCVCGFQVYVGEDDVKEGHAGVERVCVVVPPGAEVGAVSVHFVESFNGVDGGGYACGYVHDVWLGAAAFCGWCGCGGGDKEWAVDKYAGI